MIKQGILITLEGIDGSGKSTLAKNLFAGLQQKNMPVLLTKEPGGTSLGKQIRSMVQEKTMPICAKSEFLLFAADRAQHFQELIIPALQQKKIVISDRMADSSLVYQGFGRGLDVKIIQTVNDFAMDHLKPNLTFYVKVPVEVALERLKARNLELTSFEKEDISFMQRLHLGFETIFKNKNHVITLDGQESPDILAMQATAIVEQWMSAKNRL